MFSVISSQLSSFDSPIGFVSILAVGIQNSVIGGMGIPHMHYIAVFGETFEDLFSVSVGLGV